MGFFGVPLSGLIASQNELQSVSNNLANLDTVGYKDQSTSFSSVFAQSSLVNASNNPIETGLGVTTAETSSDFTDGETSTTGIASNMALTGNGFFVTQGTDGVTNYTRAGDFTTNAEGYLTTPTGQLVMGFPPATGGNTTSGVLQPLQVGLGAVIPATATTTFQVPTNLSASSAVGATFASPVSVYDSLGASHVLTVNYTKTATGWDYTVNVPTADTGLATTQVGSGSLTFSNTGALTAPAANPTISITQFADGAAPMNLTWNLANSVTQTSLPSSTSAATQDGQASGTLNSISVLTDGTVEGTYTNGHSNPLGKVAVAIFANSQGLLATTGNDYQATVGSGVAAIGTAGAGGRGTITGGSIEDSNVNVAAEFSKMIVAQQAYQANAKTVTTFQQISQATIAMISA
jgi:flagellar hook protein FlgE